MKHLIVFNLVIALLGFPLASHAGNVAYIYGDISEAGFTPASFATTGATTPYDQMLLSDTGDNGLSIFKETVEEQGHTIEQYYDQTTVLDTNFLSDKDAIVFSLHQKIWSASEKAALDSWLRNGGGMLIYSDSASGGFHRIVGAQNSVGQIVTNNLIGDYGLEAMVDQANGAPSIQAVATASVIGLRNLTLKGEGVSPIAFAPGDNNVEVLIPYTGPIRTNNGLTIADPEYAALALRPVGQGHIMALFDRQPIWNDGKGGNIQDADNRAIFATIINFLAEPAEDTGAENRATISIAPQQYHKVTLDWRGPLLDESDATFTNHRLDVTFTSPSGKHYLVPGYFAADGDAAETSAVSGDVWRAHINPDETGVWAYDASFKQGENIAVSSDTTQGIVDSSIDGSTGTFNVTATDKTGLDFNGKGKLQYVGEHFLQFSNEEYFLKVGPNSPESFLEYEDFDNTNSTRSYDAHDGIGDGENGVWRSGDPIWQSSKGRGIIGAVNYLSEVGMNVQYFLTMNIEGDGEEAYPFVSDDTPSSYDVSKLAQWQIVFDHMMSKGVMAHIVLSETENESWFEYLDATRLGSNFEDVVFADSRKLFYREMVARFGYLNAITWNIGEENGWSSTNRSTFGRPNTNAQRIAYAEYLDNISPYDDHIVVHNQPRIDDIFADLYAGELTSYTGTSYQELFNQPDALRESLKDILQGSASAGRKWVVAYDEAFTNTARPNLADFRKDVIWNTFMLGGAGVEYYIPRNDLTAQDYREFEDYWQALDHAYDFFIDNDVPFWLMSDADALTSRGFALAQSGSVYAVYLPDGGAPTLQLPGSNAFQVKWYNPREGGALEDGSVTSVVGGGARSLGNAPRDADDEWVILVTTTGDESGNLSPTIAISNPVSGARVQPNDVINIVATASDVDGAIVQVDFLLNGTVISATDTSEPFTGSFVAGNPGVYTITAIATDNDGATTTATTQFTVSNPSGLRAPDVPSQTVATGVAYDYFKFQSTSDLSSVSDLIGEPFESGILPTAPSLAPADADAENNNVYGFIYTGYLNIPEDGLYTFFTTSNDGNDFFIGNDLLIDNDGQHAATEAAGEIALAEGLHAFTLRYFQSGGSRAFNVAWQGPSFSKQEIPSGAWLVETSEPSVNVEPVVALTQPLTNLEFNVGDSIAITANASDSDGFITQVEFFTNGNTLGSVDTTAPYSATFTATTPGDYVLSVIATDNEGATKSDQITVSVNELVVDPPAGDLRQADVPNTNLVNGIGYDYFKLIGRLGSTTDLVGVPYESGILVSGPSIEPATNDLENINYYGFIFSGYIEVPENGTYTFYTTSDDGSDLFIGDQLIVDNDGSHGAQERSGEIGLEAGFHRITVRYFQGRFGSAFEYAWQGPSFPKQAIPPFAWFTQGNGVIANVEPVIELTQPLLNAEFVVGDSIAISAQADDSDGFVSQVEFFVNGEVLGSADTTAPYEASFNANEPGQYTVSAVATDNDGSISSDQVTIVVNQAVIEAPNGLRQAESPNVSLTNGVEYDYFKLIGRLRSTSDLVGAPYESGTLESGPSITPAVNDVSNVNDYGFIFNAYIEIPQSGVYTFYTTSDDGSDLFVGDQKVVDNDGSHGAQESFGEIGLEAGLHSIKVRYFQGRFGSAFEYAWQGPNVAKQTIPADVWFVEDTSRTGQNN